ncbi:MAG: VOC family protein [Truepera sp.]|jgi:glyoxalase family protein|nr:VOC family protein [Truepera sp.]
MSFATSGLHHVTAIATRPQANVEFYVRLLGQRLVKRTVNYDDPQTWHLYFGGPLGQPGTVMTFFSWPGAGPAVRGAGETTAVAYRVPAGALDAWRQRLDDHQLAHSSFERFGERVLAFADPDGTPLELVEASNGGPLLNWPGAPLPGGLAPQGLHAVTLSAPRLDATVTALERALGMQVIASDEAGTARRVRLGPKPAADPLSYPPGGYLDLLEVPSALQGRLGSGAIHHVALRASATGLEEAREALLSAGLTPTPVKNRLYFKSVYFKEPGGAILEVATDEPGFTVDEPADELGLAFKLPEWLESERDFLRARLPVTASPEYADRWNQ